MIILQTASIATWSPNLVRDLHLAPSLRSNDSFFIPLIQDAATWDANICLHLQEYPIAWFFPEEDDDDGSDAESQPSKEYGNDQESTHHPRLELSAPVLKAFENLFQCMREQNRMLHIILNKSLNLDTSVIERLLSEASKNKVLVKVETNHPQILDLLPTTTRLRSLGLQIYPEDPNQSKKLKEILESSDSSLEVLHMFMTQKDSATLDQRAATATNIQQGLGKNVSLERFEWSGDLANWFIVVCHALKGHPTVTHLSIEHLEEDLVLRDDDSAVDEAKPKSFSSTLSALLGSPNSCISHVDIKVQGVVHQATAADKVVEFPFLQQPTKNLHFLTLQAGLNTALVDALLVNLARYAPNLHELDLEGNDVESMMFSTFLENQSVSSRCFRHLKRLYVGFNPLRPSNSLKELETLLILCPQLDIGNHGMSCGPVPTAFLQSKSSVPNLFTSWAVGTPELLLWRDWNANGRSLLLHLSSNFDESAISVSDGLWPLVFERINKKFHRPQHKARRATILYQFLRSGALSLSNIT